MKLFYYNDRKTQITLQIHRNTGTAGNTIDQEFKTLAPNQMVAIEIEIPPGCVPWIKTWEHQVLFSWLPEEIADTLYEAGK